MLGPPSTKGTFDDDLWIYIEITTSSSKLLDVGKKILITSIDSNALSKKLVNAKFKNYNFIYLCSNIVNNDFFKLYL